MMRERGGEELERQERSAGESAKLLWGVSGFAQGLQRLQVSILSLQPWPGVHTSARPVALGLCKQQFLPNVMSCKALCSGGQEKSQASVLHITGVGCYKEGLPFLCYHPKPWLPQAPTSSPSSIPTAPAGQSHLLTANGSSPSLMSRSHKVVLTLVIQFRKTDKIYLFCVLCMRELLW